MGAIMTNADRDNIVVQAVAYGKANIQIAKELDWSEGAVFNVLKALELVKDNNWEAIIGKMRSHSWSVSLIEWAADRCGIISLPHEIYDVAAELRAARSATRSGKPEPVPESEPPVPGWTNDTLFLVKVLESLDALVKSNNEILAAMGEVLKELRPVEQKARQ